MNRILGILVLFIALPAMAWEWWPLPMAEPDTCRDSVLYVGQFSVLTSTGDAAPSLLHTNTNGNISSLPHSTNLSLGIIKPATRPNRWFDYDGAIVLTGRLQSAQQTSFHSPKPEITGYFRELYAHVRLYIVDITAGIHPVYYGAGDPELTGGSLWLSNNAHPIPRITVGLDNWTPIPGLFGYAELKGGITHGWLNDNNKIVSKTLFHHKFIGGRIGGKLPINISYEFHHVAQWGGYSDISGDLGNDLSAFKNIFAAKGGGVTSNERLNAQGNHILSQQLCLIAKGNGWQVDVYWQDMQEDGRPRFIGCGQNARDGLWGIHASQTHWRYISGLTLEFLQTTDQSGPYHDRDGYVFGGNDNYYYNIVYAQGWTYFGRCMGSSFCSPQNNRVMAYFAGLKGDIYGFRYRAVYTHATSYGTYKAPLPKQTTNAFLLEVKKRVQKAWDLEFGLSLAGDVGDKEHKGSYGFMFTITKQGLITNY